MRSNSVVPGGWEPPSADTCRRVRRGAADLLAILESATEPNSESERKAELGRLLLHFHVAAEPDHAWELRFADYLRLLRYPADIWTAGVDQALAECKFFPRISELEAFMRPLLAERTAMIRRLRHIIKVAETPTQPERGPPTEEEKARASALAEEVRRKLRGAS